MTNTNKNTMQFETAEAHMQKALVVHDLAKKNKDMVQYESAESHMQKALVVHDLALRR